MKIVTKTRHETRHGLHLVLTVLTCGLWAVTGWPLAWAWNVWGPRRATTTYGRPPVLAATVVPAPYGPLPGAPIVPVPATPAAPIAPQGPAELARRYRPLLIAAGIILLIILIAAV